METYNGKCNPYKGCHTFNVYSCQLPRLVKMRDNDSVDDTEDVQRYKLSCNHRVFPYTAARLFD